MQATIGVLVAQQRAAYALGLVVIASIDVGFAVANGRPKVKNGVVEGERCRGRTQDRWPRCWIHAEQECSGRMLVWRACSSPPATDCITAAAYAKSTFTGVSPPRSAPAS